MVCLRIIVVVLGGLALGACGFRPIYAENAETGADPRIRQIVVARVSAPAEVEVPLLDALRDRIAPLPNDAPRYELSVLAQESARPLNVQIDATVTRYNYRLKGRYVLVDIETGEVVRGGARATTSYNIVTSQYATLFAEKTAREKASRLLAEEIERDILLRFLDPELAAPDALGDQPSVDLEDVGERGAETPFDNEKFGAEEFVDVENDDLDTQGSRETEEPVLIEPN